RAPHRSPPVAFPTRRSSDLSANAGAVHADREPDLAGCRSGKELAQGDEVGVLLILQPSAPLDRFGTEIPQMRDRATEGGDTELEEDPEYFPGGTARPGRRNYRVSHSRVPSRWVSRRFRERSPLTST